jgi:GTPase SAR1 family protein
MSDSEGEAYEKQVKIVLVGDGSAGKVKDYKRLYSCLFNSIILDINF